MVYLPSYMKSNFESRVRLIREWPCLPKWYHFTLNGFKESAFLSEITSDQTWLVNTFSYMYSLCSYTKYFYIYLPNATHIQEAISLHLIIFNCWMYIDKSLVDATFSDNINGRGVFFSLFRNLRFILYTLLSMTRYLAVLHRL